MQNSNPSRNASYPSLLQSLLDHALLGARPGSPGATPTGGDITGARVAPGADDLPETDVDTGTGSIDAAAGESDGRLELAELLGVLRDPIEWVFTLAERRAVGDSVDIAAIHRVRDAVLHRVNAAILGVSLPDSPRIRTADVWTVSSLLIDALDPSLVARVMRGVGAGIADVLAARLPFDPSLAAQFGRAAPATGSDVPPFASSGYGGVIPSHPSAPPWYGAAMPHVGGPYLGLCPGSLAAMHAVRSIVPPWCCSHSSVPF